MKRAFALCLATLAWTSGCNSTPGVATFQTRVIGPVAAVEAFVAAIPIMRREFSRVVTDREALEITVPSQEYRAETVSASWRGLIGAGTTLRRSATLRIRRRGDVTLAEARVDIERREVDRRTFDQRVSRISDSPGHTPINRDAATTARQNSRWRSVGRDRGLERSLLSELHEWAAAREISSGDATPPEGG